MRESGGNQLSKVAIIGIAGVPAAYGGFETLIDELIKYAERRGLAPAFTIYCSGETPEGDSDYRGARRHFINIPANGIPSIIYDILSLIHAVVTGHRTLLVLGVSGAPLFPLLRLVPGIRLITNVDGVEWKRAKWSGLAKWYLRVSEWIAVKFSNTVIADNAGIQNYIEQTYGRDSEVITYGGDHALRGKVVAIGADLPVNYAFSLCRIEPENNVHMILEGFSRSTHLPLVFVGNWQASEYGRALWQQYQGHECIHLLGPTYDEDVLYTLRRNAIVYLHGHSAGGTNPSLVEMMHFGIPIFAFDCVFNRYTTHGQAMYFSSASDLLRQLGQLSDKDDNLGEGFVPSTGQLMADIAKHHYVWDSVGDAYLALLDIET